MLNPLVFEPPFRRAPSSWLEHVPFAMHLVDLLRPRLVVELGVHYGISYCAFCQAVRTLGIEARCVGIDTWTGDAQSGWYGPEVLAGLAEHHDPLYGTFSRLHQGTFDEALPQFTEGSIDLLHIDGCHFYEAAKHDFEAWLPKMSTRGVVLLHDTNVRRPGFRVWILWQELRARYPHFEFFHEHGLGVLGVGPSQGAAASLFQANDREIRRIRALFAHLGGSLRSRERLDQLLGQEQEWRRQVAQLRMALQQEQARREQEHAQQAREVAALRETLTREEQALNHIFHWRAQSVA